MPKELELTVDQARSRLPRTHGSQTFSEANYQRVMERLSRFRH
jgi:hypothetical protein